MEVKFKVRLKKLIGGAWQARSQGSIAGDVSVEADDREAVLDLMRRELRYRIEWCPCSGVADDYVELDVAEDQPTSWRGTVF